jgi:hypothetical protein
MLAAAREVGGLEKFWIHGAPEEPRPEHEAAARTYDEAHANPLDANFAVGGEERDGPGDAAASVGNVANCTCTLGFRRRQT